MCTLSMVPRVCARRENLLTEEMERYFPDNQIGVFVGTWNMHEEKVRCNNFMIPKQRNKITLSSAFRTTILTTGLQSSTISLHQMHTLKEPIGAVAYHTVHIYYLI